MRREEWVKEELDKAEGKVGAFKNFDLLKADYDSRIFTLKEILDGNYKTYNPTTHKLVPKDMPEVDRELLADIHKFLSHLSVTENYTQERNDLRDRLSKALSDLKGGE